MTPKQLELLNALLVEREVPDEGPFDFAIDALKHGLPTGLDVSSTSDLICWLLDLPRAKKALVRSVRVGVYQHEQGLVRVKQVYGARDTWTQVLTPSGWVDRPGIELAPRSRLGVGEAVAFVKEHSRCPWCYSPVPAEHTNRLQDLTVRCARKFSR